MICDRVSILVDGKLRSEGRLHEMLRMGHQGVDVTLLGLNEDTAAHLETQAISGQKVGHAWRYTLPNEDGVNSFLETAIGVGAQVERVTPLRQSLEELFVSEATRDQVS